MTPLDISQDYSKLYRFPLRKLRGQMLKLKQTLQDMDKISEVIDLKIEALNLKCRELRVSASVLVCDAFQQAQNEEECEVNALPTQILKEKQIHQAIE